MLPTKVRKRRVASYIGAGVVIKDPPADPDPEARSTPADTPTTDSE